MINTHKPKNILDRTNLAFVPEGTGEKEYYVGCYQAEDWDHIHEILMQDGTLEDNIPSRSVGCVNSCDHSKKRAIYILDDAEADALRNDPRVHYVNLNYDAYPGTFAPDPEYTNTSVQRSPRFQKEVSNYRAWNTAPSVPAQARTSLGSTDLNRTGYQLLRHTQFDNPWDATGSEYAGGTRSGADHQILRQDIYQLGDGTGVDAIVADEGYWLGHPEFVHCPGTDPVGYQTGNVLTWSGISTTPGICGVLDLVLDAPYYIDPDFFNADPGNRLTQRWDGTTVPVESAARSWWTDSTQRSAGFSTIGTVSGLSTSYSRAYCNGSNTAKPTNSTNHGTECAGQVFGKNYGVAYNCNRWVLNAYGNGSAGITAGQFDIQKLFHLYKPNYDRHSANNGNQQRTDGKNPTLSSNSWGYRSSSWNTTAYYWYRPVGTAGEEDGISYTSSSQPDFIDRLGDYGDYYLGPRCKGEMVDNSATAAGAELIESGVIYVGAAGNSNQTQTSPGDPDYNNYWSTDINGALSSSTHSEFGLTCYNTFNRRGWPQSIGKTQAGLSTVGCEFPAINVGALDDQISSGGYGGQVTEYKERIVQYSDKGSGVDCYAAADDTLTSEGQNESDSDYSGGPYQHPETYSTLGVTAYDEDFSGTSSACPTAAGWITTKLQYNRGWNWREIKDWLKDQCGNANPARFYYGVDVNSLGATSFAWEDVYSPQLPWDAPTKYYEIGVESFIATHNAPILFTQALDDPSGGGNQATWLQDYVDIIKAVPANAPVTHTTVATGGHAAFTTNSTLQAAIRTAVGSTGPAGVIGNEQLTIVPTDGEYGTVGVTTYPVMGKLYVPTGLPGNAIDVVVAFHGTVSGVGTSTIADASVTTLNYLLDENNLNVRDKIIFSAAYPQDHISNTRQYNLNGVGTGTSSFLIGDNLPYTRAAVDWAKNSLNAYMSANSITKVIGNVYLLGHSQGGALVTKMNTLERDIAGVVANAPGPMQFDQTCAADPSNASCSKVSAAYGNAVNGPVGPVVIWDAPTGSPTEPQKPRLTFGLE